MTTRTAGTEPFPERCTAIVTGAGARRGIGRAVARRLISDGWSVVAADIDSAAVQAFAEELAADSRRRDHQHVLAVGVDVSDQAAVDAAFARIDAEMPPVAALVNLAGIASPDSILDLTPEIWDQVMDINAKGTLLMTQAAAHRMTRGGVAGRIVNASSITALDGGGTFSKAGYASAKAAILGLTRGSARELGTYGITANAILPGPIDTDIMGGTLTEDRKADMSATIPLHRVGQPEEVAGLVAYLVSAESGFINGASINIDGGKHMH